MALNNVDHRLYTVTRKPPYLIVFNTDTGQEVARVPGVAGECDDIYFDASRKRVYIIGDVGLISVVQESSPDDYLLIQNIRSTFGARTGYWYARHRPAVRRRSGGRQQGAHPLVHVGSYGYHRRASSLWILPRSSLPAPEEASPFHNITVNLLCELTVGLLYGRSPRSGVH